MYLARLNQPERIASKAVSHCYFDWLISSNKKKVASLPRSTVAEKKQISWLNLFIKHCYYHHQPRLMCLSKIHFIVTDWVFVLPVIYGSECDGARSCICIRVYCCFVIALVGRRKSCFACDLALGIKKRFAFLEEMILGVRCSGSSFDFIETLIFSFNWWLYRVYILRSDSMRG